MYSMVFLAAEDVPGLAAGRRLIAEHRNLSIYREENARGLVRLKQKAASYDQMAQRGLPVLLLTDLDADLCPGLKIQEWLGRTPNPGFLLRVCVREIEAWLMADREAMAEFLKVPLEKLPMTPEELPDPKGTLIQLAQRAPRPIRNGLTPVGSASKGPDYNELLEGYIVDSWSMDRAVKHGPSLAKARQRVGELARLVAA